ncbi:cell division protein FtsA [bacterium]|nr:cell division protein FtsA [FCB group bacterium]MBL7190112.1 cell division protein FtsA [bacterium]
MQGSRKIVGLDLGTTKVSCIIAEVDEDGIPSIVGVSSYPAQGMRRGVVINIEQTAATIEKAVAEAERMAGTEVSAVYTGIAGDHIRSINSRGVIAITRRGGNVSQNEIRQDDVDRVVEAAKAVSMPMDREVIHVIVQQFIVDDQKGIKNPVGQAGVRLEADVHIITGAVASAQNVYRCVKRAGITVRDLVLEPLASSYAVLEENERELGVGMIDLGGGTSDIAIFEDGVIKHTHVLAVGGQLVTRDIAIGLNIPLDQAEKLKLEHGLAHPSLVKEDIEIKLPKFGSRPASSIAASELTGIIHFRMREIFEFARDEIIRMLGANYQQKLPAGLILTGGGALLPGTDILAGEVLGFPVQIRGSLGVSGLTSLVDSPVYATGVGLILYGMKFGGDTDAFLGDESKVFEKILNRMKRWWDEFFT